MSQLDEIKQLAKNEFHLRELAEQLESALGILPFVGAGLSMHFGLKGWQQFLLSEARTAGIERRIKRRISQGQYEEGAQDLLSAMKHRLFQDALVDEYGDHRLDGKKFDGVVSLLPQLASGPVITTNFDHVLEKAFADAEARFDSVVSGARVGPALRAVHRNKRSLLKLHGDVDDETDRVLTLEEYRSNYGCDDPSDIDFSKPLPQLLEILLTSRPVLFLGCSLSQDRVVRLLKRLAKKNRALAHYAIVEKSDGQAFYRTQQHLSGHGIRPIWYPKGRHEFVELIVESLTESISERVPPGRSNSQKKIVTKKMKATEALEVLIRQHPEIASLLLVIYRDKPRLNERVGARLPDDPNVYLREAAKHVDTFDEKKEVVISKIDSAFWKRLFDELKEGFVVAVSSRVRLKNGMFSHIPMMDFKCDPTAQNIQLAKKAFREIGQTSGILLNSGRSFHFYGHSLMSEEEWRLFLGHSLLLTDFVDSRYIGHALMNNECRLRVSTARLNPFIPTVVDVF